MKKKVERQVIEVRCYFAVALLEPICKEYVSRRSTAPFIPLFSTCLVYFKRKI